MAQEHESHKGELLLQERRNTPQELIDSIPQYIKSDMPLQHAEFFAALSYLPLATLDSFGRPWVSILVAKSGDDPSIGIKVLGGNRTDITAETNPHDPFARALKQEPRTMGEGRLFAGVGVDFSNRRRNKIAGVIEDASVEDTGKMTMQLASTQHLGNCPKYITVRTLAHQRRTAELAFDRFENATVALPVDAKATIDRASTVFLATKHISEDEALGNQTDMGVNHRGGAPGFTRIYEEKDSDSVTTYLVLPDHSGNRFYQSLGNIETHPHVGLVFPDFTTGHVLYVTGEAENLQDAEAEALMPRTSLLTRIKVTGAVFVKSGLNLALMSEEQFSPYNPPVKHLRQELEELGHATVTPETTDAITATLVSTHTLSDKIRTFNFELSTPIDAPVPGGFGVFDFSKILNAGYSHMNDAYPQLVNEDYVRTWTLSSAAHFDGEKNAFLSTDQVSITVKRKSGGLMSSFLHDHARKLVDHKLPVEFKGTGAGFTCFSTKPEAGHLSIPPKMLWIAGGVGVTPFMAMWDAITQVAKARTERLPSDIVLLFCGRDDDINVLKHFASQSGALPEQVNLSIVAFQSVSANSTVARSALDGLRQEYSDAVLKIEQRHVELGDIQAVADLHDREVFLCGPDALMAWCETTLSELNVAELRCHRESFIF